MKYSNELFLKAFFVAGDGKLDAMVEIHKVCIEKDEEEKLSVGTKRGEGKVENTSGVGLALGLLILLGSSSDEKKKT